MWDLGKSAREAVAVQRFEALVLPHLDAAYNLARWILRHPQDAEDIVQEACLRAFKHLDGFHGEHGRAWLLTIVRNACYTGLENKRRDMVETSFDEDLDRLEESRSATAPDPAGRDPEALLLQEADRRLINRALERLPLEFREVLVLREFEDLSYKEIAVVAGIPIGTVMSRLARGRQLLKECIKPLNEES
jgi:RNA polymerase sigma factor (sigma-70 family)